MSLSDIMLPDPAMNQEVDVYRYCSEIAKQNEGLPSNRKVLLGGVQKLDEVLVCD